MHHHEPLFNISIILTFKTLLHEIKAIAIEYLIPQFNVITGQLFSSKLVM